MSSEAVLILGMLTMQLLISESFSQKELNQKPNARNGVDDIRTKPSILSQVSINKEITQNSSFKIFLQMGLFLIFILFISRKYGYSIVFPHPRPKVLTSNCSRV